MHSETQLARTPTSSGNGAGRLPTSSFRYTRFFMWTIILLFITLGSGLYFWSQEKYESKAGTTTSAPEAANTRASTGLASYWKLVPLDFTNSRTKMKLWLENA